MNRPKTTFAIALMTLGIGIGCSRQSTVYPDPAAPQAPAAVMPVSTDGRAFLPKEFYNQSVNRASVEIQPDGVSATSKSIRFQTSSGSNPAGGFNGVGLGNRAIVGINGWHSRPVAQAEPITFDARNFSGVEKIGVNLQIDLKCDGTALYVVNAKGSDIAVQNNSPAGDGYTRFTASTLAAVWLSPTSSILDPDTSAVLVPASGTAVTLSALLTKFPLACLKNAATSAIDLAARVPTAAVLISLGDDATATVNTTFVRRLTIGSAVHESFE